MNTKFFRDATQVTAILLAIITTIFGVLQLPVPDRAPEFIGILVAFLIASGICVQTGQTAVKLTWATFLQKLSSPVWWASLGSLIAFFVTMELGHAMSEVLRISLLVIEMIGIIAGIINDPNNKKALKNDVALLESA